MAALPASLHLPFDCIRVVCCMDGLAVTRLEFLAPGQRERGPSGWKGSGEGRRSSRGSHAGERRMSLSLSAATEREVGILARCHDIRGHPKSTSTRGYAHKWKTRYDGLREFSARDQTHLRTREGEGGSKNPKLLRTYLMDGPLDKHAPHIQGDSADRGPGLG